MPSFDVVSEIDKHEVTNAVDQANREVETRFDFKGSGARFEQNELDITLQAATDFQLRQMIDILRQKIAKRGIDVSALNTDTTPELALNSARQKVSLRHGIDTDSARSIVKLIKSSKVKVQAAIQGDQVRVTGKKRDDLQQTIALLRESDLGLPLQYTNFRD